MSAISKVLRLAGGSDGSRYLTFHCPGCDMRHQVVVARQDERPVWGYNGNPDKPTFTPSILVTYRHPKGFSNENPAPVGWHGEYVDEVCHSFVTDGRIQFLGDCTHALAGQTVNLPEIDPGGSHDS